MLKLCDMSASIYYYYHYYYYNTLFSRNWFIINICADPCCTNDI